MALSDPKDPNLAKNRHCSDGHQRTCEDCSELYQLIDEVANAVNGLANNSAILYDVKIAKENIFKWQQHIIRHFQQNKAKVAILWTLSISVPDYGLEIKGECSYFGKKGMTLHTDVFFLQSTPGGNKH